MSKVFENIALTFVIACCICWTCVRPAYAYVDPSVMTYAIQALAGVAVAVGATLGVAFRRTRKKVMKVFHIDENADKAQEPPVKRLEPNKENAFVPSVLQARLAMQSKPKQMKYKTRFLWAFAASFLLMFTIFFVAPIEIVVNNSADLLFHATDVWWIMALFVLVLAILLASIIACLKGRAFYVAVGIVFALALAAYIQSLCMNNSLPIADGKAIDWSSYLVQKVISTLVWVVIITAVVLLAVKCPRAFRNTCVCLGILLVIVQMASVVSMFVKDSKIDKPLVTEQGLYDVSEQSNVVVFVLDTFDTSYLDMLLDEDKDALSAFTGFTYYKDSTGSLIPTRYAIPFLLTGSIPQENQSYSEYIDTRYAKSTFMNNVNALGYSAGVYSNVLGDNAYFADKTVNVHAVDDLSISFLGTIQELSKASFYRELPWIFKQHFWFYSSDLDAHVIDNNAQNTPENTPRVWDDVAYYQKMLTNKLTLNNDETSFRFIHLEGTHWPYTKDENVQKTEITYDEAGLKKQAHGALKMVAEYIQQLKDLGVYDKTTIIVTADHGKWYLTPDAIDGPTSPIMLVKPAQSAEKDAQEIKISSVPVSHMDVQATLVQAMGGDTSSLGVAIPDLKANKRKRYYYMTTTEGKTDSSFKEMCIDGYALDFSNWSYTGKVWSCFQ